MRNFKWNLDWTIDNVFIPNQPIPVTHNFKPIGWCSIQVIEKKFYVGHFELTQDLKGSEYLLYFFEMNTVNGNELGKIEFSDLYTPVEAIKTVKEMMNENGGVSRPEVY